VKIAFIGPCNSIHLVRWLRFFCEQGWQVMYLGNCDAFCEPVPGVELVHFVPGAGAWRRLGNIRAFRRALQTAQPDLVNIHYLDQHMLAMFACGTIPVVLSGWGDDILIDPLRSAVRAWAVRRLCRRAALVTSMAPHMTAVMTEFLGIPEEKILTQLWGCDTRVFTPRLPQPRVTDELTVFHNRMFEPIYQWEPLVRAIPLVRQRRPRCRFLFANRGNEEERARRLVQELGVADAVEFLGMLPAPALAEFCRRADVFVSLAQSDGNNISLNEAMACGAYPVCSDTPAHRQWVTHGRNGYILSHPDMAAELAEILVSFDSAAVAVRQAAEENYRIVRERADWYVNMGLIAERYRQLATASHVGGR